MLFKRAVSRGERPGLVSVQKAAARQAETLPGRALRFTISTAAVDRENDTVALDGWSLDAFRRNPVVLWGHDQSSFPIGRAFDIRVEAGALKATVAFVPADVPIAGPVAEAVYRMCCDGFLGAASVGFLPRNYRLAEGRDKADSLFPAIDFLEQELTEFSIVTVPANVEATIDPAGPTASAVDGKDAEAKRLAEIRRARFRRQAQLIELMGL